MNKTVVVVVGTILAFALPGCSREAPQPEVAPQSEAAAPAVAAQEGEIRPVPMDYEEPVVGGAKLLAGDDIFSSLTRSGDHKLMVRAIRHVGLEEIFGGSGPITVFAPTDAAFRRIPGGFERLLEPANEQELISLLSYHVVPERLDDHAFAQKVLAGNDQAQLATVQGGTIKATVGDGAAILVDQSGAVAKLTVPNVLQSNGVLQVIDKVLLPAK
jgi:uncharacterized surface protein with fasciclin (FAS1) repeats